ncbi:TetR family transcriptional regulator [Salinisphaera sp. PC39]|uniref:TetR/AcrR family transcriptional regulator n=1 Tax=Salinisphaera sp. PC39 TaxID=1304156 RepID=UPI00333EA354
MPRKPASQQGDTVRDIREAAFVLFGRYGYDGVSIGDIAAAAGLSKGALYWHFSGKTDLFLDCLKRLHRIFEECIFTPMQNEPHPGKRIILMFRGVGTMLENPRVTEGVGGFWLGANSTRMSEVQTVQRAFERRTARVIRDTLAEGTEQGLFNLHDDIDAMSHATIAVMEAIILPLRHQSAEEAHQILGVLARTVFRAYGTSEDVAAMADRF